MLLEEKETQDTGSHVVWLELFHHCMTKYKYFTFWTFTQSLSGTYTVAVPTAVTVSKLAQ